MKIMYDKREEKGKYKSSIKAKSEKSSSKYIKTIEDEKK